MRLPCVQNRNNRLSRTGRTGFTLVELLVVIAIIAILMALALGVISKVYLSIDEMRVTSEINKLSESCSLFKSTFGRYPPSRIILCENGTTYNQIISGLIPPPAWSGLTPLQWQQLATFSTEYLTNIFPGNNLTANNWDGSLNAAGNPTLDGPGVYQLLEGQRCLVYFLGGLRYNGSAHLGFNTDKSNPTAGSTGARLGPFFEFEASRLTSDLFPAYKDTYGTTYAYFAAKFPGLNNYPNRYLPNLVANISSNDCETITTSGTVYFVPYFASNVPPTPPAGWPTSLNFKFHRAETYQIISAGKDRQFGTGGQWNQADPEQSLFIPQSLVGTVTTEMLQANYDNITNVSNGRVVPK